jgi:D-alanyl-D-alanine carboxypeptidase
MKSSNKRSRPFVAAFLLAFVFSFPAALGQSESDAELDRLRESVQKKLNEFYSMGEFPGATIGFVLADGRSASVSVGFSDVENKTPLRPADKLQAGSIGKTFAAAVILQAVEDGKLRLDDKIEKWLGGESWFARLPNSKDITLRMLMNHTSGIPEHVLDKQFIDDLKKNPDRVWKPEEMLAYIFDRPPLFAAGKGWSYADTNYIVAGMIFERATKKNLYDEVARRILRPLKLKHTVPSDKRVIAGLANGYSSADGPFGQGGKVISDGKFFLNPQFEWTGGGFASTPQDLALWAKAMYEGRAFSKQMLDEMLNGVDASGGRGAGGKYGLACQMRPSEWGESLGHSGFFPGYLSNMEYFPRHKIAVSVQVNTDDGRKLKRPFRQFVFETVRIILSETAMKKAA